jgi:hypothetical protein
VPITVEQPPPPLHGVVIIQQHLIVATDGRHHFALSLASVGASARTIWTTDYIRPRNLHTPGLIALLPLW